MYFDHRRRDQADREKRAKDLDETRRLLLIIADTLRDFPPSSYTVSPDLGATVANAFSAHSKLRTTNEAVDFTRRVRSHHFGGNTPPVLSEIEGYIADIDQRLAALQN